jgi:hypothetical protein
MNNLDKRENFLNFLIDDSNLNIETTTMKEKLEKLNLHNNIIDFKRKFNAMIMGLSNYEYYIYDMLNYYNGTEDDTSIWKNDSYLSSEWKMQTIVDEGIEYNIYRNNLSDFILNLILNAINSKFDEVFTDFYMELDSNNYNPNSDPNNNFIKKLKDFFSGNEKTYTTVKEMQTAGNEYFKEQNYKNIFLNMLNLKIFDLYIYVLEIEQMVDTQDNDQGIYFIKNFITMNILKYFYLSELLLKVLLDTKENINSTNDNINITVNDYTPVTNNYKEYNVIKNEFIYENTGFNTENNSVGMKLIDANKTEQCKDPDLRPKINMVYKIIKDIYLINEFLKRNNIILKNDNIKYIINPDISTDTRGNKIKNLSKNIQDINKNITELNLKNLNIEKDYEKNRNIYYITFASIIIYIFLNLYVIWSGKIDSLLTLNGIIIIFILLTKFLDFIKKSYQTLFS